MIKKSTILTIMGLIITIALQASTIGTWKNYMAYYDVQDVQQAGKQLYVLASNDLYVYNENDQSIQTYDKTNGLSDTEIQTISYNKSAKRLIILYTNYNIDLLDTNGDITNIAAYHKATLTTGKTVNHIDNYGKYAYLSTAFGVMKINVANAEISETYNLGFNVNWTQVSGNYIYAYSSQQGQFRALTTSNLQDKSNWIRVGEYVAPTEEDKDSLIAFAKTLNPGGPKYNYFGFMKFYNGKLYTCGGGYGTTELNRNGCIQVLNDNNWTIYEDQLEKKTGYSYVDITTLAVDPLDNNHVFAGGRTGLYEFDNGKYIQAYSYDNTNNILQPASSVESTNKNYVIVSSLEFDTNGNLYGFNSRAKSSNLFKLTHNKEWTSLYNAEFMYNSNNSLQNMSSMMFDSRGLLWIGNNHWNHPYLFCYQPSTQGLNTYKEFINEDGTTVSIIEVRCIAEDKSKNIWIGTNVGPIVLKPNQITSSNPIFNQIKVPRNDGTNLADYLLSGIDITCIAVDEGGRKWFGTNNKGVYLISEDNYTQEEHFTTDNSLLLSNNIESIAINSSTGEVFISTDKGLCSYMSRVTKTVDDMNDNETYAYPNPVKPGYTGPITITGLSYNSNIKIVTTNGTLVTEGTSTGGSFVWDGKDLNGKRVASGIYMVEIAKENGEKGFVCKIAIIN
ncbi:MULTISPECIES: type IX secretion system anionic LPS delivery protein PorZ [Segatella]|uniref:Por secretion system protein n=2 Tax=Segatella TaxID=2974251 RepID=A0AA37HXX3_SEGBR|nr:MULTISPECIES: two-component regulator propeller domain-containing protein [Segatella]MBQ3857999.1 Por secretion system protein [Prevotella sp.]EFI71851.1 putative immunoreactive 84kD antigen PG93 [Segatella baroniae B14]OYP55708.1 Por secretion system protein [Segatella bryantii]UKK74384.1 T9SS type A sorting domain-containing protein [Segatella bryantii]UKK76284.1 T9SS type A sorting domain-containing protein [Segatella bryantii]